MKQSAVGYIASADSKATGLLAVSGALLALLVALAGAASDKDTPESFVIQVVFAAFALVLSLSVAASALVLLPRTNRTALLPKDPNTLPHSPTYFGDIKSLADCEKIVTATTQEQFSQDYIEQAFVIARIAKTKFRWMQASVWLLLGSLVLLVVVIGVRLFFAEPHADPKSATTSPEQAAQPAVSIGTVEAKHQHAEQDLANNSPEQVAEPAASSDD